MPHLPPLRHRPLTLALALLLSTALPVAAPHAQEAAQAQRKTYSIAAGPLEDVLTRFAAAAGLALSFDPKQVDGLHSAGLNGTYTGPEGLHRVLQGSGLEPVARADGSYTLRAVPKPATDGEKTLAPLTVRANADRESATGPVKGYIARRSATGTKTDTPITETPQSISVVTVDFVEAIGVARITDALAYTPGIDIAGSGTDSRFEWPVLRGFNAYTPGPYLDGLQQRGNNTWAVWQNEAYGLERIEVLRGPGSVLYGQMPPGGTINSVSKRPLAEPAHEVLFQIGQYGRKQLSADSSGPLDGEGKWLYRVVGSLRDGELPVGGMPDDRQFLAPSLTWRPSNDTALTLLASYLNIDAGVFTRARPVYGSLLPTPAGTTISSTRFYGEADFNRFKHEQWSLGYLFEHRLNDTWQFRQNLRHGEMMVDYRDIYPGMSYVTVNANPADPANYQLINRNLFGSREKVASLAIDNQAQADFTLGSTAHTLLFGLDYQRNRYDQISFWSAAPAVDVNSPALGQPVTIPAPYADQRTVLAQTGFYVQDQIAFADHWRATLGARYDKAKIETDNHLNGARASQKDSATSYRAGLVYAHPSGWAPYLSYAESFSPVTTIDPATGKPFDPETGRQYEAGLRYQPAGGRHSYAVALFDLRRQNYVSYSSTYVPRQTGEIVVRGLELEARLQPVDRANIVLAYTLTPKADVTQSENPAEIGKQSLPVSRHRASLWADYRFASGIKIGAGARHVGSNRGYGELAPAKVPAYTVYDLLLGYQTGRWNLALNFRNLGDKNYIANCDTSGCYYGEPRSILATIGYRW